MIVIIQARMGSTRLPGKILKTLGQTSVLGYVVNRCKAIKSVTNVIVATSSLAVDDEVEQWCKEHQIDCCRGSELDVLDRYIQCAKPYSPDYIMRVTADCPFIDFEMADAVIDLMKREQTDIVDYKGELPRGLVAELISYKALLAIHDKGKESRHREHVTYYAYECPDEFERSIYQVPADRRFSNLRITIDTEEDYIVCREIANHFNDETVPCSDVIKFLLNNPKIANINSHIEQKLVE